MEKTLVSLCVMFHNQKDYVERTLAGAFSQTYSPLEIVISDDASTDGTSELISGFLKKKDYTQRGFKLILHRNEKALGMLGNREKVYSLANGELLVNADGDDISYPQRVEHLVSAWLANGKKHTMLTSEAIVIDENDRPLGETHFHGKPIGATLAIASNVLPYFPPVCHDAAYNAHDDLVYHIRASLFGETFGVNEPLIFYRYGSGESSGGKYRKKMVRGFTGIISGMKQVLLDLKACEGKVPEEKIQLVSKRAIDEIAFSEAILPLWTSHSFITRLNSCVKTKYYSKGFKLFTVCIILLLPQTLGDILFLCSEKLKRYISLRRARKTDMGQLQNILAEL